MMRPAARYLLGWVLIGWIATGSPAGAAATDEAVQTTAILCGRLIDGNGGTPRADAAVIVEADRIVAITDRDAVPSGATVIDLGGATLLPGLIDAHVHPLIATDDYQIDHLRLSSAAKALRGLRVVRDLLDAGWTTLRIAGDADVQFAHLDVRDAIEAGDFIGPRLHGAGHYLSVTGGGGDLNFLAPEQSVIADGLVVDGVDGVRRAVRREIQFGSDWIKLLVTGAFMSAGDDPRQVHFSPEELRAAVEEAARRGVPVMAHAHSAAGIVMAAEAGVRSVEHGTFIDADGIAAMRRRGTFLVPTLYIGDHYLEAHADSDAQQKMVALTRRYRGEQHERLGRAIAAGVRIGVGTDNVGFPATHGVRELALLVEVGMTSMQAIGAATRVNADLLGRAEDLGTVEPGRLADLIAVAGDPLTDLSELERVTFVMLGGRVIRSPSGVNK